MIFERITIKNLFSYYGEQTFDKLRSTRKRPVVLIAGRNGFGKTSFINSIKLLFLGTSKHMLDDAQVGRSLRPNAYLLGIDHAWQGAFNLEARNENQQEYGVSIDWLESKGRVKAKRYWHYDGADPIPFLRIETDFREEGLGANGVISDQEEAEEFLQRRLPREIVSFFFYDGEKVQALAEANEQGRMKQIEKLLGLAAVDTLDDFLRDAITSWKNDGTEEIEQAELDSLKSKHLMQTAERAKFTAEFQDLEADIENVERDIRRHERFISNTRALADQSNAPHLEEKIGRLQGDYERLCQKIGATLPIAAPAWAAPMLVESVGQKLDTAAVSPSSLLADEMQGIFDLLPGRLFDEPTHPSPALTSSQKNHYKKKLSGILKQYTEVPTNGYLSLDARETLDLQRRINYFRSAQHERLRLADDLREASRLYREWQAARAELEALDDLSPEQKKVFRERQAELKALKDKRDLMLIEKGRIGEKVASCDTEIVRILDQISHQETKRVKAGINSKHIERASLARRVFDLYSYKLKVARRQQIEEALNSRFKVLMSSHKLINKIELGESFAIRYLDHNGHDIGLANISAGMKQLAAQALLWALAEVSAQDIPVIVDTPLARIDREHQLNLLKNYYPNAAQQVFMLPTNAELDAEKYDILKPRISAEFALENPTGNRTLVIRDSEMYVSGG